MNSCYHLKYTKSLLFFLFFVGICVTTLAQIEPVANFSFNNGSNEDDMSNKKPKLVGVNFTDDRFGNSKSAIYLFGNENSYINLGNYSALKPRAGTISLWVKIELEVHVGSGSKVNPIIITKCADREDFYEAYAINYILESKRIDASSSRDSLKQLSIYSMNEFTRLTWHHLAVTFNDSLVSFYIDGNIEGTSPKNYETLYNPLDSVMVGVSASKRNNRFLNGVVDDIMMFDKVLNAEEIHELYEAPNPNRLKVLVNRVLMVFLFLALIALIYFIVRYRLSITLKKEKQKLELENLILETELRVNRALMNPHFVFNSLGALQNFILKDENARANNYLVKFSKLIRRILENNLTDTVSLDMEIELLKMYLDIEDLRFEENIQYNIEVEDNLNPTTIRIPIMMLQPFIENSIWHGLLKKDGEKFLKISFKVIYNNYLQCIIEDNGIGRITNEKDFTKKRSLATGFIEQRLNLLNRIYSLNCTLEIEDKPNRQGTIVTILLPILKK